MWKNIKKSRETRQSYEKRKLETIEKLITEHKEEERKFELENKLTKWNMGRE